MISFISMKLLQPTNTRGYIMGNIRPTYIKRVAVELVKRFPEEFKADDYQHNKKKVEELTDVDSNMMRNKIAGYVVRYMNREDTNV